MRSFLWCYYGWFITSLALEKCKKEFNILEIILVENFCPLKIKITQFPDWFRLNYLKQLGYLKDSNAAAHSVDTGISQAVRLKSIENDIERPIYVLESTRIITISL